MVPNLTGEVSCTGMEREMEKGGKEMQQILSMKGGLGEESYANNSKSQVSYNFSLF